MPLPVCKNSGRPARRQKSETFADMAKKTLLLHEKLLFPRGRVGVTLTARLPSRSPRRSLLRLLLATAAYTAPPGEPVVVAMVHHALLARYPSCDILAHAFHGSHPRLVLAPQMVAAVVVAIVRAPSSPRRGWFGATVVEPCHVLVHQLIRIQVRGTYPLALGGRSLDFPLDKKFESVPSCVVMTPDPLHNQARLPRLSFGFFLLGPLRDANLYRLADLTFLGRLRLLKDPTFLLG